MPQQTWMGRYWGMLAVSILLCGLVAPAMAQVSVYDDFSGDLIDATRWRPNISGAGNVYEMRRQVVGGKLVEALVVNGATRGGGSTFGRHELRFVQTEFTALAFEATVLSSSVIGCPTPGSQPSWVAVDAQLTLFNDGSSTAPDDETGDVAARLEIVRSSDVTDPPEVLQVTGHLTRCADPSCATREAIGVVSLGPVVLRQRNTYVVDWEAPSQLVAFWKNTDPAQSIPYPHTVAAPRAYRALRLSGSAADCTADPRPGAHHHR
jgi:hypothetical protein